MKIIREIKSLSSGVEEQMVILFIVQRGDVCKVKYCRYIQQSMA